MCRNIRYDNFFLFTEFIGKDLNRLSPSLPALRAVYRRLEVMPGIFSYCPHPRAVPNCAATRLAADSSMKSTLAYPAIIDSTAPTPSPVSTGQV